MTVSALAKYDQARQANEPVIGNPHAAAKALAIAPELPWRNLPSRPGVYVLIDAGRVLYVGESKNLATRMAGHEKRAHIQRIGMLRVVLCSNHKEVERWLIKQTAPTLNGSTEAGRRARAIGNAQAQTRRVALGINVAQDFERLATELFGSAF